MSEKYWKIVKSVLLIGTILATIKLIFVDYTLDEEYQIVMAYRTLRGDHLFREMWEPHQTSAFLCSGLMWLYTTCTGTTTGIIIFLRLATTAIQAVLSLALCRTLRWSLDREYAFVLSIMFFNITPKNIQIPEFANMQLWFLTIPILLLMKYYHDREQFQKDNWYLLIIAGIGLSCEVLSYPTCIILYPFFLLYLWRKSGRQKIRDCAVLTGTCGVSAILWLAIVLQQVSLEDFLRNLKSLLFYDPTHDMSGITSHQWQQYAQNLLIWGSFTVAFAIIALIITQTIKLLCKKKEIEIDKVKGRLIFWGIVLAEAEIVQIFDWVVYKAGYEHLQIHFVVLFLMTISLWRYAGPEKHTFSWGIFGTLVSYLAVMYISDLMLNTTLLHGVLGITLCAAVCVLAIQNIMKNKARTWILLFIVSLCLCSILARGYTLRNGREDNTIWAIGGVMKDGPAAGIFANYIWAYIYNCNYEEYRSFLQEDDNVLIVANMQSTASTSSYMFKDVNVSHFSVVDPTTYDERLLTYWQRYPEKQPNVIVVDCWFGELREDANSWIMQYIENEFGYTEMLDGTYVRFYRR